MRGEDAHVAYAVDIELLQATGKTLIEAALEEPQGKQGRMPFVHVVDLNLARVQLFEQPEATKAEHDFLRQTVSLIPAVKAVCQPPVVLGIFREVGVQKVDRDAVPVNPRDDILPRANRGDV